MPKEKAGACSKLDRVLTFGDSYSVLTRVEAAASSGSSVRRETRRITRAESVRKSMIVLTPETGAANGGQMKRKKTYGFSVVLAARKLSIEECDALYEAGCDDGTIVTGSGVTFIALDRKA